MLATYQTTNYSPSLILKAKAELELRRRRRLRDDALEEKRKVWREKPEVYAKERLNLNLTDEQFQIIYSVKNNRRTAVKAHHSLGKTFIAAVLALWWIDCWDKNIVYITAPTWGQALGLTFKQAKRLATINRLDFEILESGLIRDKDKFKQTERFIKALNAESGEGFQGEHTAPILIIIDEAIGVPGYIFDAAGGLMTNPACRQVEIANPTDESTTFGENCESPNYEVFSFSALDHPNIRAELNCLSRPFEGAVSLVWLFEMLSDEAETVSEYSPECFEFYRLDVIEQAISGKPAPPVVRNADGKINHELSGYCFYKPFAYFEGRVLGEFPSEASTKVIPKGWLKNAPELQINAGGKAQIGCDTARFGDDRTAMFGRIGKVVVAGKILRQFDNVAVASAIKEFAREVSAHLAKSGINIDPKKIAINIDTTGGLGTGPYDILKSEGWNALPVNSSASPKNEEKYVNIRSELWFDTRDRFKDREIDYSRLAPDMKKTLEKELSAPLYEINSKGKKVVEDKAKIKKRLGFSPDLADGFNLAFYEVEIKTSGSMEFEEWL